MFKTAGRIITIIIIIIVIVFTLLASVCNIHSDNMNISVCTVYARVVIMSAALFVFRKF